MSLLPRKCRRLAATAGDIMRFRGAGRPLTPAAYVALMGLLYAFLDAPRFGLMLAPTLALFVALALLALFDARWFVLPDGPLLALALIGAALLTREPDAIPSRLAAAALGYGALRAVDWLYARARGYSGLGEGDARLYAVAGLWLGLDGLAATLLYGVFSALVAAVAAARTGAFSDWRQPLPFGPHLALGFWLCWVVGPLVA